MCGGTNKLRLTFTVPETVSVDYAAERLAVFMLALSAYHIACGGDGLVLDETRAEQAEDTEC